MARSHHPLITGYYFTTLITCLVVVSIQKSSLQLGPAEGFKESSDVIFPGEPIKLECVGSGLTKCDFSLHLNNTVIYQSGILLSGDYFITKNDSFCCLNIQINNVTIQLKGIYKCRVDSGGTTIEDSYELNVVTEWPHCLAKCVESGNSFQLSCFTVGPTIVSMRWEISKGGSDPTVFLNFIPFHQNEPSFVKTVGVSYTNINKEDNLTIGYRCSHVNDSSQSCFINFTSLVVNDISSPTISSTISTSLTNISNSLRHTSLLPEPDDHEQSSVNQIRNIIISSVTIAIMILSVFLVIAIYKLKDKRNPKGRKKSSDLGARNDLVQTGNDICRSTDNGLLELSGYEEMPVSASERKYESRIFTSVGEIPSKTKDSKQQRYETKIFTNEREIPNMSKDPKQQKYETKIFRN